jgi:hypothetical protein
VLCAPFFVPAFVEGSQPGPERISVDQLAAGQRPTTSYVIVTGRAVPAVYEEYSGGTRGASATRSYYVPLISQGPGSTIPLVVHYRGAPTRAQLEGQTEFEGILQGAAFYDGLTAETRTGIAALTDAPLTDEVDVLDVEWTPAMRREMAWGIFSAAIIVGLMLGGFIAFVSVTPPAESQEQNDE